MRNSEQLETKLWEMRNRGELVERTENNPHLKVSYKGTGSLIPEKWNVKIYKSGAVVCVDLPVLEDIMNDKLVAPDETKTVIQIDDAGIGFPLLGVMAGATNGTTVETDIVGVSFFQSPAFENKEYLKEYARKGWNLITKKFKASPKIHRIEICTGFVNTELKSLLRSYGFQVNVVEVKGLLQDNLERLFKEYVHTTLGIDLAYDPKEMKAAGNNIGRTYYQVLGWGKQNAPHLLKTGWKSMQ